MARLFVEQLTVIDASRLDPVSGLVGVSWLVDVELAGTLDAQGMVLDFGHIKRDLKAAIDAEVDHRLLVPAETASVQYTAGRVAVHHASERGPLRLEAPALAVAVLPGDRTDRDAVAHHLQACLEARLPANVEGFAIRLREEVIDGPWYAYSHGLEAHDGACQRIAHGHRSRVVIERDGVRAPDWEAYWAQRWENVFLGTRSHRVATRERDGVACHTFRYQAREGVFELELPAAACDLLEAETTVERIADHMAAVMAAAEPGARFRVCAFEGVGKGAIALT